MKLYRSCSVPAAHIGAMDRVFHQLAELARRMAPDRIPSMGRRAAVRALAARTAMVLALLWMLQPAQAAGARRTLQIVAFGDSLSAGFQLKPAEAFPARLEAALKARGHAVEVANAGVSGDTTAAGLQRLDWAVPDGTDIVILELGANDMLRGQDPASARTNLDTIIKRLKAKGATVLLAGMRSLGNWGPDYAVRFEAIFPDLAKAHGLTLYPFFLDGVVGRRELNLADGMHPNPQGVDAIVRGILPTVEQVISEVRRAKP